MAASETYLLTERLMQRLEESIEEGGFENGDVFDIVNWYEREMDWDLIIALKALVEQLYDIHPKYNKIKKKDYRYHMDRESLAKQLIFNFRKNHNI